MGLPKEKIQTISLNRLEKDDTNKVVCSTKSILEKKWKGEIGIGNKLDGDQKSKDTILGEWRCDKDKIKARGTQVLLYPAAMKILLVFDFDHTIINDNSDTWIVQCVPGKKLPNGLQNSYEKGKWTEYMGRVFSYLGEQGIREEDMKRIMISIPYTPGMTELLHFIAQNKGFFDCIIISDSNTIFIDWILTHANVHNVFDKVFTNPAAFDSVGNLTVQNCHVHHCATCPTNLCKKKVLEEFVAKQSSNSVHYSKIVYVGDGGNDLCPLTFLKKSDIAMPRAGYTLDKRIAKDDALVDSAISVWSTGAEILSQLKLLLEH